MLFIVGARRSGTFWLQRMVTAHSQVSAVPGETYLFSHGIAPLLDRFQHGLIGSPHIGAVYIERDDLDIALRHVCDAAFAPFRADGTEVVSERTPVHALELELIRRVYPDARFIHIIRDGRDVVRSLVSQAWGLRRSATRLANGGTPSSRRAVAAPERTYLEVRYEDLLSGPHVRLAEIFDWLSVGTAPEDLAAPLEAAGTPKNLDPSYGLPGERKWMAAWDARDLAEFEQEAGGLLVELGYSRVELPRRSRRASLRRRLARNRTPCDQRVWMRDAQEAINALIGALRHDPESARTLLSPDLTVQFNGESPLHGPAAADRLIDIARADQALRGRQRRGQAIPEDPEFRIVIELATPDGTTHTRELAIAARDGVIHSVAYNPRTSAPCDSNVTRWTAAQPADLRVSTSTSPPVCS